MEMQKTALKIASEISKTAKELLMQKLAAVIVYGSYARADFDEESDVDIIILADCPVQELDLYENAVCRAASRLSLEYDVTVSVTLRDLETFNKYKNVLPFYQNIEREGIKIA